MSDSPFVGVRMMGPDGQATRFHRAPLSPFIVFVSDFDMRFWSNYSDLTRPKNNKR